MIRWRLCGAAMASIASILFGASILLARQGVLKTKDGQTITGDIDADSNDTNVLITVHNVKTVVPKDNVASISYSDNADAEYQSRLNKLDASDVNGRLQLAQWAFELDRYDLADQACQSALAIDPSNQQAKALEATIQQQMILDHRTNATPPEPGAPTENGDNGPTAADSGAKPSAATALTLSPKYLDAKQINIVKQDELTAGDPLVRISFSNDVRRKYIAASGADATSFLAQTQLEQAMAIISNGPPKLLPDVRVLNDPIALAMYKQKIQPMILSGCAASGCHSGGNGGSFFLYNSNTEAATYTNFYLLQQFQKSVTVSGQYAPPTPVSRQMIDRSAPDQSLLLQYALPPLTAAIPHPKAGDYRGIFRDMSDPRVQTMMTWMGQTLANPAPNYGFKFTLPLTNKPPTTAPATQSGQ